MAGADAILGALRDKTPKRTLEKLPENVVSNALNQPTLSRARRQMDEDYVIHVSDLMRKEKETEFCPRQVVLEHIENRASHVRIVTPGRDLMFATAHMFHEHVVNNFVSRSPYRDYVYGQWACVCGRTSHTGYMRANESSRCKFCQSKCTRYQEYSFYWPRFKIVGHPDLLFLVNKRLYVYEIKTLDRRDVDIRTIRAPLAEHVLQASFYYHMARAEGFVTHPFLRFLYVDRSSRSIFESMPYREFSIKPMSLDLVSEYLHKAQLVADGVETLKLPPGVCDSAGCSRAKNCPVRVSCFSRSLPYAENNAQARKVRNKK